MSEFKGTKGRSKITERPKLHEGQYIGEFKIRNSNDQVCAQVAAYKFYNLTLKQAEENAKLIVDAFNVRQKIKVDLKTLHKQHNQFLKALKSCVEDLDYSTFQGKQTYNEIKQLIQQATTIK